MDDAHLNLSAEGSDQAGSNPSCSAVPLLDYGRGGQPWRLRSRHIVIAALLAGCVAGSWLVGRSARQRTQEVLYLRQAAAHVDSANTIVFESNPQIAAALVEAGTHVQLGQTSIAPVILAEPDCLRALREAAGGNALETVGALVFLHELVTPNGARRIVAIQFLPHYLDGRTLPDAGLVAHIFEVGGVLRGPTHVGESHARLLVPDTELLVEVNQAGQPELRDTPFDSASRSACIGMGSPVLRKTFDPWGSQLDTLRWYAGQPDDLDQSHFTIDYEIAGQRGTIDGYLSDDGRNVRMQARPHATTSKGSNPLTRISAASDVLR